MPCVPSNYNNIIATLEHHDRVHIVELWGVSSSLLETFPAETQKPFPNLTFLELLSDGRGTALVVTDSHSGGLAPHLQTVHLKGITFPPVIELLLSATDLVDLDLWNIPHSGFVLAGAIITCPDVMTRLKTFYLGLHSRRSHPNTETQHPPLSNRTVLPALIHFKYRGVGESLEDLVARMDTPC
jgi:hypothetical protein